MYTASQDFKTAALANFRKPRSRVEITWTDSNIDSSITVSANDQNRINLSAQVANGISVTGNKWAHLNNKLKADGTFHPMPSTISENYEVGWYGATMSDINGEYTVNPVLTVNFNARAIDFINVVFDTIYEEYAIDFNIRLYQGAILSHTEVVTNNDQVDLKKGFIDKNINACTKIELEILKWSEPYQCVKVCEFYNSVVSVYYDNDIVGINILEEMDYKNGSITIGNISSNELDIELTNDDSRFRVGNSNSFFYNLLKKNRKIQVWLGFVLPSGSLDTSSGDYFVEIVNGEKIGFVPYGVFYSSDWISSFTSITVTSSCFDLMEKLRNLYFDDSLVYENITLEQLAHKLCESAKLKLFDLQYIISPILAEYTVPIAYFENINYFEAIKKIVQAGLTFSYVNRNGVLIIGGEIGCIVDYLADDYLNPLTDDYGNTLIK